ncbi:MAG: hypothetical protein IPJ43_02575 [Saprospiraceae bacterium]|nr:hypothetical protein [Saprospiraceae bacterium]
MSAKKRIAQVEELIDKGEEGLEIAQKVKEEGIGGAIEIAKDSMESAKEAAVEEISQYTLTAIAKAAAAKVATLFIPGGAIIEIVRTIYDLVMWLINNIKRIISFFAPEKQNQIDKGFEYLYSEENKQDTDKNDKLTLEQAQDIADRTKKKFSVFSSLNADIEGDELVYNYTASPKIKREVEKKLKTLIKLMENYSMKKKLILKIIYQYQKKEMGKIGRI